MLLNLENLVSHNLFTCLLLFVVLWSLFTIKNHLFNHIIIPLDVQATRCLLCVQLVTPYPSFFLLTYYFAFSQRGEHSIQPLQSFGYNMRQLIAGKYLITTFSYMSCFLIWFCLIFLKFSLSLVCQPSFFSLTCLQGLGEISHTEIVMYEYLVNHAGQSTHVFTTIKIQLSL